MSAPVLGGVLGLVLGVGLWLIVAGVPLGRHVDLIARLEPYLRDTVRPSSLLARPGSRAGVVQRMLAPVMADAVRVLDRVLGSSHGLRRRLEQAGSGLSLEQFRAEQVVWGVAGAAAGTAAAVLVAVTRGAAVPPMVALVVIGTLSGVLARDQALSWQVSRREQRMMQEFPTVAELLALSVGAGEGAVGALERVATTCSGELSGELRKTLAAARAGASLLDALEGLARRTSLPPLARFVDGVAVAVQRGTPLGEVLRAQAQDVRELGRRRLMESGGRREIAMMVPVVFFVLPVTVLFAVYPGLVALRLEF